jgi:amidase
MDVWQHSASALARMIAARKIAPSEVMAAYLARIAAINPGLNAIVSLRDDEVLMAEARVADDMGLALVSRPCARAG